MTTVGNEPSRSPKQMSGRATFVVLVGGTFGLQGLTVVTGVITARLLGVEGRGIVALVFALGLLASQLTLGGSLPTALAKNLAERHVGARDGLRGIVRSRAWLILLPCIVAAGFMLWLHRSDAGSDRLSLAAIMFAITLQTILSRLLIASLQGEAGHLLRMIVVALIPQFLFAVALTTTFLAGWQWSTTDVLLSSFAASVIGNVIGFAALARPTHRREDRLDERHLWRDTRTTYVSSVRPLDSLGLDRILVGTFLGNAALGLYAAAIAVGNLCGTVGNAVSVIVLPQVAQNHADPDAQRAVARRWLLVTVGLVIMIVVSLQIVVAPVIRLAFGTDFEGAIGTARWLILADGFFGIRKVLISILQGQGRGGTASWIELALTPVLVLGIGAASLTDNLPAVGMTMLAVGVLSCLALGIALRSRAPKRAHR